MGILNETQLERDKELARLLNIPLEEVQALPIAQPDSIRIFDEKQDKPKDIIDLYSNYEYMNFPAYLRTLMQTSITRRSHELITLLQETHNAYCLDFGSGVGTHSIALMENGCDVVMLDVPGKLQDFAVARAKARGHSFTLAHNKSWLPYDMFDVAICTDVLEHVPDPMADIRRITSSLKKGGKLHLLVSTMVKPSSGHFSKSIKIWKQSGLEYMNKNYSKFGKTIWRKK